MIGTSTNLVVDGLATAKGLKHIGFFEPAYVAGPAGIAGIIYMVRRISCSGALVSTALMQAAAPAAKHRLLFVLLVLTCCLAFLPALAGTVLGCSQDLAQAHWTVRRGARQGD